MQQVSRLKRPLAQVARQWHSTVRGRILIRLISVCCCCACCCCCCRHGRSGYQIQRHFLLGVDFRCARCFGRSSWTLTASFIVVVVVVVVVVMLAHHPRRRGRLRGGWIALRLRWLLLRLFGHGSDSVLLEFVRPQKVFVAKFFAANFAKRFRVDDAHLAEALGRKQLLRRRLKSRSTRGRRRRRTGRFGMGQARRMRRIHRWR